MGDGVRLEGREAGPKDALNGENAARTARRARRSSGQVIPILVGALVLLLGMAAIVIDVAWYWSNTVKVQRAADAAALAGAVWLPGNVTTAYNTARTEAQKNGYVTGGNVTVTPIQDSLAVAGGGGNPLQLNVTVSAPVGTFFARIFGINSIVATRVAKAEYVQPVPMGSPQDYYGVYENCNVSGSSIICTPLPSATAIGSPPLPTLASQGFFGAIEGQGSNRSNGDAFATAYNPRTTPNSQYDSNGYDYQIEIPTASGQVWIYDPTFCATTSGPGGGHLGAGDHWLNGGSVNALPVSTYFRLWDMRGTAFTTTDDVLVTSSGNTFANEYQVDKSPAYATGVGGEPSNNFADGNEPGTNGTPVPADCRAHIAHNRWWQLASGLAAGVYRLQVTTTDPANATANQDQMFENMWSLQVVGGGSPRIYGSGRMVSYANIQSGAQIFYLAQIDRRSGIGKTLQIDLFDPGDTAAPTWLQILSPDGNTYAPVRFNYTADANASAGHTSGTNVTCIQTRGGTGSTAPAGCPSDATTNPPEFYQNSWIRITIPLSLAYGAGGLIPPGEPAAGWWKIKYTVNKGNDTTTWMVSLRGNPVHLVP
jgi:hypothetical protein